MKLCPLKNGRKMKLQCFTYQCVQLRPMQYWLDSSDHMFWGILSTFKKYFHDFCSIENFWTWFLIMCTYKSMPKRWKNQLYTLTRYTFRPLKWLQIQNGGHMPCSAAWNHMIRNNHCDRKNCVGCLHWVLIMRQLQRSNENWKSVNFNYEVCVFGKSDLCSFMYDTHVLFFVD